MSAKRRRRRGGFTLVEVLASMALIAIVVPAAAGGVALAMELSDSIRHETEAATLARGRLAEATALAEWQEGSARGEFDSPWDDYSWRMDVEDWDEPGLSEVAVTVSWQSRGRERVVTMTTLAYLEAK